MNLPQALPPDGAPLSLTPGPLAPLRRRLTLLALVPLLPALLFNALPASLRLGLSLTAFALVLWQLRRPAFEPIWVLLWPDGRARWGVLSAPDRAATTNEQDGHWHAPSLSCGWLVLLPLRRQNQRLAHWLVLWPTRLPRDDFRRLRVWLRCSAHKTAAKPIRSMLKSWRAGLVAWRRGRQNQVK